jgi:CelD/BcsL family acetyltransferase involved in cellulose biosynthesis
VQVVAIDPIDDCRWDEFITSHPDSTIFHHSAWARVLRDRYGEGLTYRAVVDERGRIVAVAPFVLIRSRLTGKRLSSLPGSEYCFPLAARADALQQLVASTVGEIDMGQASYLEIRGWRGDVDPGDLGLVEDPYYLGHVGALQDDPEALKAELVGRSKQLRRSLKKAEQSGLTVREANGQHDLRRFHNLTVVTRRRLRLLPWPLAFLDSIWRHVVEAGYGFLLLAEKDGHLAAGSLYFCFGDTVLLKFNASDRRYTSCRPNHLVTWHAMERGCVEGYQRFDLGTCDPENQGLAAFKRYWATQETVLPYYYYPSTVVARSSLPHSLRYRAYTTFSGWAPEIALRLSARLLYRHMG